MVTSAASTTSAAHNLRRDFTARVGVTPTDYRRAFRSPAAPA
ncbi:hypothetical protein [Kitasatospora purpeofusca]|nr:hypothetical protein [Kitasatospora purpeofusca]MCX4758248.1 hypothetical protein [Kitasatospora purpeofusca]WSR31292.1 hypothetical protein OG715_10055 [Kitasatospora purpeofusca]